MSVCLSLVYPVFCFFNSIAFASSCAAKISNILASQTPVYSRSLQVYLILFPAARPPALLCLYANVAARHRYFTYSSVSYCLLVCRLDFLDATTSVRVCLLSSPAVLSTASTVLRIRHSQCCDSSNRLLNSKRKAAASFVSESFVSESFHPPIARKLPENIR